MLFYSSDDAGHNQSPFIRFMMVPVSTIQRIRNFTTESFSQLSDNFKAKSELAELHEAVEKYQLDIMNLNYKLREFEAYREASGLVYDAQNSNLPGIQDDDIPGIIGIVLVRDNRMTYSLIIDRGINDGLEINQPVTTNVGLVGRISELSSHTARVLPLNDPRSNVGVFIEGTPYEGLLSGMEEGEKLHLSDLHLVSLGEDSMLPEPGDPVYTSGTGRILPRNLLAGIISDVTDETGYLVDPVVDVRSVKSVRILTNTPIQDEIRSLMKDD